MNNKNMYAIYNVNLRTHGHLGVKKKMLGQVKAMSTIFHSVILFCADGPCIVEILFEKGVEKYKKEIKNKHSTETFFLSVKEYIEINKYDYDFTYIRYYPQTNNSLTELLKFIYRKNKNISVEIYTLGYENEFSYLKRNLDLKYRKEISQYVSSFVSSGRYKELCYEGKPLYYLPNGIDMDYLKTYRRTSRVINDNIINMIGVGFISAWHGYDKILRGIREYIDSYPVFYPRFYIVGEGPYLETLKDLSQELKIEEYVSFTGSLDGDKLMNLYEKCHIGIGTLDFSSFGVDYVEPLKHREFIAINLPFIYSVNDPEIKEFPGAIYVDSDSISLGVIFDKFLKIYHDDVFSYIDGEFYDKFSWKVILADFLKKCRFVNY